MAAPFGQCKCGHPKQSHTSEGENKAAAALRALRSSAREPSLQQSELCSNYTVDVSATTFGQCYCGHPKDAHVCKSENKAATERAKLLVKEQEALRLSTRAANMLEPCSDFKVDTKAEKFGTCICGHPQDAHVCKSESKAARERAKLVVKEQAALRLSTRTANMLDPCSDFKVDTKAEKFGICICGHAQAAHKTTRVNPAEAALRAMKETNAKRAAICEEELDPNVENETMIEASEASPKREAEQNSIVENEISTGQNFKIGLRHDFGLGVGSCSFCRWFCRNRGCQDTNQTICHRCWPEYIRERDSTFKSNSHL